MSAAVDSICLTAGDAGYSAFQDSPADTALQVLRESDVKIIAPPAFGTDLLLSVHAPSYLDSLSRSLVEERDGRDTQFETEALTACGPRRWTAAQCAAYSAAAAAKHVSESRSSDGMAFAVSYPNGRHAYSDKSFVGCYVNSPAVAATTFLKRYQKVVLLSIGAYHADGVQEIFYHRSDVMTISLHAKSRCSTVECKGVSTERGSLTGYGYNLNFLLPDHLSDSGFLGLIENALDVLHDYRPQAMVVALGFQGAAEGKRTLLPLNRNVGRLIGERLSALGLPTAIMLEIAEKPLSPEPLMAEFLRGLVPIVASANRVI